MSVNRQHKSAMRTLLAGLGMLGAIAALSGCGGSSEPNNAGQQQGQQTPQQSNPDVTQATSQRSGKLHATVQKSRPTPEASSDDLQKRAASQFNPCRLVTVSEAHVITGGAVTSRTEAPLGPTCIYSGAKPLGQITVTIESRALSQVSHQMQQRKPLTVGNRRGYCGRLGAQMLYVPLTSGEVLHVTAPCAIAEQFAIRALPRIGA